MKVPIVTIDVPIDMEKIGARQKEKYCWENERLALAIFASRRADLEMNAVVRGWAALTREQRESFRERALELRPLLAELDKAHGEEMPVLRPWPW